MVILLNKKANSGRAELKWNKISNIVLDRFPGVKIVEADNYADLHLLDEVANGEKDFISAGGDGTLNFLLNVLMRDASETGVNNFRIGAIGLGSSNDFHKPYNNFIESIPLRLDFENAIKSDVGTIEYDDDKLGECKKYWVINSSLGILADANKYFNHYGFIWEYFKRHFVGAAIFYAALSSIIKHKNKKCDIISEVYSGKKIEVSNIGITKNPNFAGDFSYPEPYYPANGLFGLHIIEKTNLKKLLAILLKLWNNKNKPMNDIKSGETDSVSISSEYPLAIEFDGEVVTSKKMKFSIINKAILLCK